MNRFKTANWLKKLAGVVGVAAASTCLSFNALAGYNPYYSFFNPGPGALYEGAGEAPNLVEEISVGSRLTRLATALRAAGMTQLLSGTDQFTIFAPTDEAFTALPPGVWEALLRAENREILVKVLNYHLVPGRVSENDLNTGQVRTMAGVSVQIRTNPEALMLNEARVAQKTPITTNNGLIVLIDKVLLPPDVAAKLALGTINSSQPASVQSPVRTSRITFECHTSATTNLPTTYAITPQGARPLIRWNSEYFSEAGYTPQVRCQQVAAKFQSFADSGQLKYLTAGAVNGQSAICVANTPSSPCTASTVLFTLKPGSDANERLRKLFNLSAGSASSADILYESSAQDDSAYIDFDKYLSSTTIERLGYPIASPDTAAPSRVEQPNSPSGGRLW